MNKRQRKKRERKVLDFMLGIDPWPIIQAQMDHSRRCYEIFMEWVKEETYDNRPSD